MYDTHTGVIHIKEIVTNCLGIFFFGVGLEIVMTPLCVWHDYLVYAPWLLHLRDRTHSILLERGVWIRIVLRNFCHILRNGHDSTTCVTWLVLVCAVTHFICLTEVILCCWDGGVWVQIELGNFLYLFSNGRDLSVCDTQLVRACVMTHSSVWQNSF